MFTENKFSTVHLYSSSMQFTVIQIIQFIPTLSPGSNLNIIPSSINISNVTGKKVKYMKMVIKIVLEGVL